MIAPMASTDSATDQGPSHLETARLRIRPFRLADVGAAHRVLDLDQAEPGMSRDERQAALAYRITQLEWDDPIGCYAVEDRASGTLIGYVGLQFHVLEGTPATSEVELFYKLGRSWWGRGYATEACRAMLGVAFDRVGLARTVSVTERANHASIQLLERLGAVVANHPRRDDLVIGMIQRPGGSAEG